MNVNDLQQYIWQQLEELNGEGAIVRPEGVTPEEFERVLTEVEEAMHKENKLTSGNVRVLIASAPAAPTEAPAQEPRKMTAFDGRVHDEEEICARSGCVPVAAPKPQGMAEIRPGVWEGSGEPRTVDAARLSEIAAPKAQEPNELTLRKLQHAQRERELRDYAKQNNIDIDEVKKAAPKAESAGPEPVKWDRAMELAWFEWFPKFENDSSYRLSKGGWSGIAMYAWAIFYAAALRAERDAALVLGVTIPEDILKEMLAPPVCGCSQTSVGLGLSAATMGGCGEKITDPRKCFRCADCQVPFHHKCLQRHCTSEKEAAEAELRTAREALQNFVDSAVTDADMCAICGNDPNQCSPGCAVEIARATLSPGAAQEGKL